MIRTVGFLGFGNMAQAMADGLLRAQALPAGRLLASAHHWERLQANTQRRGMVPCRDNRELAQKSDLIIAAVKPYLLEEVLAPLREDLRGKAVVSVAAGWSFDRLSQLLGEGGPLPVRHAQHPGVRGGGRDFAGAGPLPDPRGV